MAAELELEKKVRVMFPPILHQQSEEGDLDSYDSELEQPSLHEKITSTITSEDPVMVEPPFLPKVKGGCNLASGWNQEEELLERKNKYLSAQIIRLEEIEKKPEKQEQRVQIAGRKQTATEDYKREISTKELELATTKGIFEIFTRSVEQHSTVDKMWSELKVDATKRLRPIILHCHRLNRLASPSTRQCLDIYKKPTPIDKYTGKPIPLGQVLNQVKKRATLSQGTMSILNSALGRVVRFSQMRAELMLKRKGRYNQMASDVHQDWFFTASRLPSLTPTSPTTRTDSRKPTARIRKIRKDTSTFRKNLPFYLTSSGSLVSASIEELDGEILYCTPSTRYEQELDDGQVTRSSSIFLTDVMCGDTSRTKSVEMVKETTDSVQRPSTTPQTHSTYSTTPQPPSTTSQRPSTTSQPPSTTPQSCSSSDPYWEPLTSTALLQHASISQIPIRGRGHLAHGRYQMWRPDSCPSIAK